MTYDKQLKDSRWKVRAAARIILAAGKCEQCQETKRLNVHHKIYMQNRMAWDYPDDDLEVLCRECHKLRHGIESEPKKKLKETIEELQAQLQEAKIELFRVQADLNEKLCLRAGCDDWWAKPESKNSETAIQEAYKALLDSAITVGTLSAEDREFLNQLDMTKYSFGKHTPIRVYTSWSY